MSPLLLEAAARRPQETDLPDMSPLLLDVACRSLQLMSWHEMSPLAACRETEGALYVQAVLYENVPGTGRQTSYRPGVP